MRTAKITILTLMTLWLASAGAMGALVKDYKGLTSNGTTYQLINGDFKETFDLSGLGLTDKHELKIKVSFTGTYDNQKESWGNGTWVLNKLYTPTADGNYDSGWNQLGFLKEWDSSEGFHLQEFTMKPRSFSLHEITLQLQMWGGNSPMSIDYFEFSGVPLSGNDRTDPVPLPSAVLLLGSGLLGLVALKRRRVQH